MPFSLTVDNVRHKQVAPLGLIALSSAAELGEQVDTRLRKLYSTFAADGQNGDLTFLIPNATPRFQSGDAKGMINKSVRGLDLYLLVDVGNYSCTYKMYGKEVPMSPDDHFADLKRIIQAVSGKAFGSRSSCLTFTADASTAAAIGSLWTVRWLCRNCRQWASTRSLQSMHMTPASRTPYL